MSNYANPQGPVPPGQPPAQASSHPYSSQPSMPGAPMQGAPMSAGQAMHQGYAPQQPGLMPAGGYYAGYHPAYQQMQQMPIAAPGALMAAAPGAGAMPGSGYSAQAASSSFLNLGNDRFLKGLLIGAAAAYLLTNESVQRTAIKGVVKLWGGLQGGVEEIKERFHDAEAEIQASESHKDA
ncbi:YtxH domain-containing protein [Lamprobacter modestohalophilus]|uniref:YtxH domain-containing protein n=1 Tax=Lamprobacter modestohalophilus TaxID=1064514 RepID=UPI001F5B7D0B|nr:YtxH domain-containing protein [Lamprobacter modestohalophilus]